MGRVLHSVLALAYFHVACPTFAPAEAIEACDANNCSERRSLLQAKSYPPVPLSVGHATDLASMGPCAAGTATSALLLTMHNTKDRQDMTDDIMSYYANLFPKKRLFLVDSAGNGVKTTHVGSGNQVLFRQDEVCDPVPSTPAPTSFEICSMREAFRRQRFKDAAYVFKLTAKYKLPALPPNIETLADGYDFIFQNDYNLPGSTNYQNTELWGGRVGAFEEFLDWARIQNGSLEKSLWSYAEAHPSLRICRLPPLINRALYRRGNGDHLDAVL